MKKLTALLFLLTAVAVLTGCGAHKTASYENSAQTANNIYSPEPTGTIAPTPTPVPEGYLTFAEAQAQEGFFVKHGDWYIDILKYNGGSYSEEYVMYPRKEMSPEFPINDTILQLKIGEDKIVYFSKSSKMPRTDITPASFCGYALPITFGYRGDGKCYLQEGNFGTGVADKINGAPITDDMFTAGFYLADHGTEVTISGFEGTQYIEETETATSNCYEIRTRTIEGKYREAISNGYSVRYPYKERVPLETSLQPTTEGYAEVVFTEPLTAGMYVLRNSKNEVDTLIEAVE